MVCASVARPTTPAVRLTHDFPQTVSNDASNPSGTTLVFETELVDTVNLHTPTDSRITAPIDGLYVVNVIVRWDRGGDLNGDGFAIELRKNGTERVVNDDKVVAGGVPNFQSLTTVVEMCAGDYVEVFAYTNSSIGANILGALNGAAPEFLMVWISSN